MSDKLDTRVIQVTNVAPSCTNEQMRTLFSYLGRVKELKMYPPENTEGIVARVAYIEFDDSITTGVALHLSGTVFIDRALMVVPVMDGKIPDEHTALQLTPQAVAGMLPGQPTWPANVVSQVTGTGINQVITTYDPRLTSLGLPQYPPLPASTDASKIEEIRRTVYVSDLDPAVSADNLMTFFSQVGEIKYIRLAGDQRAAARAAYIEFTDQRSVAQALTYNNVVFQGRTMSVQHSKTNIVKPISGKINEASQREIDEAMKKVKEASKLISAAASESKKDSSRSPSRKRSRSKSKARSHSPRRSRSRSKGRRRRTRSRSRRRSRSRHRSPRRSKTPIRRRRSRSRGRVVPSAPPPLRRSRSRDRRRSRTRSPIRRRRSRTRSRSRRRSRTPPRSYSKRSHSRNRRKSPTPRRRSRSRDRKERVKERKKSVSLSPPQLERSGSIPPKDVDKDKSPAKIESSVNAEGDSAKISTKKRSPTPLKSRRVSPSPRKSPRKRSRSRSQSRRKRRRRTRTPSPRKRSRSRSGSRSRTKRERSKRSRSRERRHESKKKSSRDKEVKKKESGSTKVKRDYDEEEKGFASGSEKEKDISEEEEDEEEERSPSPPTLEVGDKDSDHQTVDMDMSD